MIDARSTLPAIVKENLLPLEWLIKEETDGMDRRTERRMDGGRRTEGQTDGGTDRGKTDGWALVEEE